MNILTFESEENESGYIRINDYRALHMKEVIKVSVGQEIRVGQVGGFLGVAIVEKVDSAGIAIRVKSIQQMPSVMKLDLLVALPRPQTLKKILELAACFSVRSLTFVASAKVENSYFQSSALETENIKKHLILGLQQGVKTYLPKIMVERDFTKTVERLSEDFVANKLVADKEASKSFKQIDLQSTAALLAIGPERGWVEQELDFFMSKGFLGVNLSSSVLRVENAVCCALSQFELVTLS